MSFIAAINHVLAASAQPPRRMLAEWGPGPAAAAAAAAAHSWLHKAEETCF